ncbi:MAG: RNA 2',3'-cyclic phosphodiesterase [Syntrophobacterales bacterium]|nr:RNA 2',3'-cyclic phosphodiesterase [Syntrophobacterales bacterium]
MTDGERVRSFLAIDLPEEVKAGLGRISDSLKRRVGGVRWTRPEGIHLTLKFFGDISGEEIARISMVAGSAAGVTAPFQLTVEGLGVFPGLKRPRVLWVGVGGRLDILARLQGGIESALEAQGFKKEGRGFKPHLTLGRFRSPGEVSGIERVFAGRNDYRAGGFTAEGLTLFKSDLTPKGAVYSALEFFPFKGKTEPAEIGTKNSPQG